MVQLSENEIHFGKVSRCVANFQSQAQFLESTRGTRQVSGNKTIQALQEQLSAK